MICPNCQKEIPDNSRFCVYCRYEATSNWRAPSERKRPIRLGVAVAGFVALALLLGAATGLVLSGSIDPISLLRGQEASSELPQSLADQGSEQAESEADVANDPLSYSDSGLPVRATLDAYSWDEISSISSEIAAAGDEASAIEIAKTYNLVNDEGRLDGTQIKRIKLRDGTSTQACIIGFIHDKASNDSAAGISFLFSDCVAERGMNALVKGETGYSRPSNIGGWEASEMRGWLQGAMMEQLPQDLQDVIVPVIKMTNNVGDTDSVQSVTPTEETLWLPSVAEVAGNVGWYNNSHDDVLNAEGSQYLLFREKHVNPNASSEILLKSLAGTERSVKPLRWWLRSPSPYYSDSFRTVRGDGDPSDYDNADDENGVALGFCI